MSDDPKDPVNGNLGDIAKKRKEKKGAKIAPPKKAELFVEIAKAINQDHLSMLPPFPGRWWVTEPSPGMRLVLRETDVPGVVQLVPEPALAHTIAVWCQEKIAGAPEYVMEYRHYRDAVDLWKALAKPIPMPKPFKWLSEDGLAFSRLPWDPIYDPTGELTPRFNELLSRISNNIALMHWIGSLFDMDSDRQQYIWLWGAGNDGKGALSRFMHKVMGASYRALAAPRQDREHFWTKSLLDCRLGVFPDCNSPTFVTGALMKSVTGDDPVPIEPKGKDSFTALLAVKFMFLSNKQLGITSEKSDKRRAILCHIDPITCEVDPTYEAALYAEGGAFLGTCMALYKDAYPNGGPIRTDTAELDDAIAVNEERWRALFDRHFVFVGRDNPVYGKEFHVTGTIMDDIMEREFGSSRRSQKPFKEWLLSVYNVLGKTERVLDKTPILYRGVVLKDNFNK